VLIGEGTSAVAVVSPGTSGQVLTSNGASADPTYQTFTSSGTVNSGTQYQLAYYATTTNAVSGDANIFTDVSNNLTVMGNINAILNPGTNDPARGMISSRYSSDQASAHFSGKKARNTLAAPTAVQALDYITALVPNPYDGTNYLIPGEAVWQVSPGQSVSAGVVPVDFVIQTGTGTPGDGTDRMRVGYDGHVNIGLGNNVADVNGTLSVTAIASTNAIRLNTSDAAYAALDVTSTGAASAINVAQGNLSFATSGNGIKGTITNNNASPGIVGEFISNAASGVSLATQTTFTNICSITLSAGDWDVCGTSRMGGNGATFAGASGYYVGAISIYSGNTNTDGVPDYTNIYVDVPAAVSPTVAATASIPPVRISVAGSTIVYLKGYQSTTVSIANPTISGSIQARRVR
jgi:hypothetical protein